MRFRKKFAKLILEGKKTLELRRYPPRKEVYVIQVGNENWGRFRVKRFYKKPLSELTDEEVARAGFESREMLIQAAIDLRLWPECFLWEIELLEHAERAGGPTRPSGSRPQRGKEEDRR